MNLELSITCLLCLTQRLPATSKHMSIGIPMPVCLEVVERRLRSLNHVCSELQSSFIILVEFTHEVVGLHPMLSNSYLLSSCFWVFCAFEVFIAFRHAICLSSQWDIFLVILMALLGCFVFYKKKKKKDSTFRVHSAITFIFLLPKIENEEILGYKVELEQAWFKKAFLFTVVYYEQWS